MKHDLYFLAWWINWTRKGWWVEKAWGTKFALANKYIPLTLSSLLQRLFYKSVILWWSTVIGWWKDCFSASRNQFSRNIFFLDHPFILRWQLAKIMIIYYRRGQFVRHPRGVRVLQSKIGSMVQRLPDAVQKKSSRSDVGRQKTLRNWRVSIGLRTALYVLRRPILNIIII